MALIISLGNAKIKDEGIAHFSGRVSRINKEASMIRIKVDFHNVRFLNKSDKLEFWFEQHTNVRCLGFIVGKTNEYLLVKIPKFNTCIRSVPLAVGNFILMYSKDLESNIKVADELNDVLLKKRLAIESQLKRKKLQLETYIEKLEAVNSRYKLLQDKLQREWQENLTRVEDDRATTLRNYRDLRARFNEVNFKIEKYRVEDSNKEIDRWSLDPKLYIKK